MAKKRKMTKEEEEAYYARESAQIAKELEPFIALEAQRSEALDACNADEIRKKKEGDVRDLYSSTDDE